MLEDKTISFIDPGMMEKAMISGLLRNQVTSPGGTSAEALYYLAKARFRTALSRAIWAAYKCSISLGKDDTSTGDPNRP